MRSFSIDLNQIFTDGNHTLNVESNASRNSLKSNKSQNKSN